MEEQQDDEVRAADVCSADLERRPGGKDRRAARVTAAFAAELASGLIPGPSVSDVVVRRRDDGTEVLRVPAGDPTVPGDLLAYVRGQLGTLGPAEFLQQWAPRSQAWAATVPRPGVTPPRAGPERPGRGSASCPQPRRAAGT